MLMLRAVEPTESLIAFNRVKRGHILNKRLPLRQHILPKKKSFRHHSLWILPAPANHTRNKITSGEKSSSITLHITICLIQDCRPDHQLVNDNLCDMLLWIGYSLEQSLQPLSVCLVLPVVASSAVACVCTWNGTAQNIQTSLTEWQLKVQWCMMLLVNTQQTKAAAALSCWQKGNDQKQEKLISFKKMTGKPASWGKSWSVWHSCVWL